MHQSNVRKPAPARGRVLHERGREVASAAGLTAPTPAAFDGGPLLTVIYRRRLHSDVFFCTGCSECWCAETEPDPALPPVRPLARALPASPSREQQNLVGARMGCQCIL